MIVFKEIYLVILKKNSKNEPRCLWEWKSPVTPYSTSTEDRHWSAIVLVWNYLLSIWSKCLFIFFTKAPSPAFFKHPITYEISNTTLHAFVCRVRINLSPWTPVWRKQTLATSPSNFYPESFFLGCQKQKCVPDSTTLILCLFGVT